MRISDLGQSAISLRSIYSANENYDNALNKISSKTNIIKGHEDPALAQKATMLLDYEKQYEQYIKNNNDAKSVLDLTESELAQTSDVLTRVKELTVQASSSTVTGSARNAIVQEINELINEVASEANETYNGKYIFSGTKTLTKPFDVNGDPPTSVTYNGNNDGISYEIYSDYNMKVNLSGDSVYTGVLNDLITIRDHIQASDITNLSGADMTAISNDINKISSYRTELGAKSNIIDSTLTRLTNANYEVENSYSNIMSLDVPKATTDLYAKQNAYQMSLSVISKFSQLSLANYLK